MADIKHLEKELWGMADNLRANSTLTSQQYCMPILGLIFLRYAWGRFKQAEAAIEVERKMKKDVRLPPVTKEHYLAKGAMWLPEEARYDRLVKLKDADDVCKAVNDAMFAIEAGNKELQGILPKNYDILGKPVMIDALRLFNKPELDAAGDDIIGRIYEYFLEEFSPVVASDDGVFFTPKSLVRMIMNVIEPDRGIMLDPACGSGGMFVSASDYVRANGGNPNETMTFYGQEKVSYNAQLCLMNMAVHGMNGQILSGDGANTFYNDAHNLEGRCDFVAANPPFNVDEVKAKEAQAAGRMPLGISGINKNNVFSNANYLWINYFYAYLKDEGLDAEGKYQRGGRAGFVMASSATDSSGADRALREALVKTGHVDALLYVGGNFFYTRTLPCTLWFFDKGKPENLKDKVLFVDAQRYHTELDAVHNAWSDWQLKNLSAIFWLYRGETDKYTQLLNEYISAVQETGAKLADVQDFETFQTYCGVIASQRSRIKEEAAKTELDNRLEAVKTAVSGKASILLDCNSLADLAGAKAALSATLAQFKATTELLDNTVKLRSKKALRESRDAVVSELENDLKTVEEVLWLTDSFGAGTYQDIAGLCKIATVEEIEVKNWSLTPGAYVGTPPVEQDGVDFHARMTEIHAELLTLQQESNDLMAAISKHLKVMGVRVGRR